MRKRGYFASEATELTLGEKRFLRFDFIKSETGYDGLPHEYMPQDDYDNAARKSLNSHGHGPFCRFSVSGLPTNSGVYAVTVDRSLMYVGISNNLQRAWGQQGFASIQPANCYVGGQITSCKVNNRILQAAKEDYDVELWIHETPDPRHLKKRIVSKCAPPWNM